jgi:N-acetyl sugar amidotransferase
MSNQTCTKTVMDSSDPDTRFDQDGVSNHYWEFRHRVRQHWKQGAEGTAILERTIDTIRRSGNGKDFDCILGLSGGVDSSYMLHKVVVDFGLKPLVFHVDGGWNTELAVSNISRLVEKLGVDLFTEVINWEEMRDFQLAMFKSGVPHLDIPQDMAFIGVLYKFAAKHGITWILNGGNISTECVQTPKQLLYWGTDMVHVRDILSRFGTVAMKTYPFSSVLYHKLYLRYLRGVRVFKPLNLMPYRLADAINVLQQEYNWKPYQQKHFESRFTRYFEGYWLPTRFGYDMRRRNFSSLILTNQMTREEALTLLEQPPLDRETVEQETIYVATKLGISTDELLGYHAMPKKFFRDYRNQHKLFELGERVLGALTGTRRGGAY